MRLNKSTKSEFIDEYNSLKNNTRKLRLSSTFCRYVFSSSQDNAEDYAAWTMAIETANLLEFEKKNSGKSMQSTINSHYEDILDALINCTGDTFVFTNGTDEEIGYVLHTFWYYGPKIDLP